MAKANVTVVVALNTEGESAWLGVYPGDTVTVTELRAGKSLREIEAEPIWGVELCFSEAEYIADSLGKLVQLVRLKHGQAGHA
jgi:hypothetical protein